MFTGFDVLAYLFRYKLNKYKFWPDDDCDW